MWNGLLESPNIIPQLPTVKYGVDSLMRGRLVQTTFAIPDTLHHDFKHSDSDMTCIAIQLAAETPC